jgi:hypothetical protein
LAGKTIESGTTVSAGYTIAVGTGPGFTLTNFGVLGGLSLDGVKDLTAGNTVVNSGVVIGSPSIGGEGIGLRYGGFVTNQSGGTISGAFGIYVGNTGTIGGTIVNLGQVTGVSSGYGSGGVVFHAGGNLTNAGTGFVTGSSYGITAGTGGAVAVTNQATIIGGLGGVFLRGGGGISQSASGKITASYAVAISGGVGVVTNAGTIKGTNLGVELGNGGTVTNAGGALITGSKGVHILAGAGTVFNSGTISSSGGTAVGLAAGFTNLLALYPGGSITGLISGGNTPGSTAISTLELGSGASIGTLAGIGGTVTGFNRLQVLAGASWVLTGDSIAAASQPVTDLGTLSSNGTILQTVTLGSGASFTNVSGGIVSGGTRAVYGISGSATVSNAGTLGSTSANSIAVALTKGGSVHNTGVITGAGYGVVIQASPGSVYNDGRIAGTGNDGIFLVNGGAVTNPGTVTGLSTGIEISGGTGFVQSGGSVGGGSGAGVQLDQGGEVIDSGGMISGAYGVRIMGGSGTLIAEATIHGGSDAVKLAAGFTNEVRYFAGARFIGTVDGGNTIGATAVSTLELAGGTKSSYGQLSGSGSQFVNFANVTVDAGAYWSFPSGTFTSGVNLTDNGALRSNGVIPTTVTMGYGAVLSVNDGAILAANYAVVDQMGPAFVANFSTIALSSNTKPGSFDIDLAQGGTVANYLDFGFAPTIAGAAVAIEMGGSIGSTVINQGLISASLKGVYLRHGGIVDNSGTIVASGNQGYGIVGISGPTTVINSGTIASTRAAVRLAAGFANRVVVAPGGVFNGLYLNGGNTLGATATSTLEFATGSGAGYFGGFGGKYLNFGAVAVDAGATWTFGAGPNVPAGEQVSDSGTLINNGTIPDTVTLGNGAVLTNASVITVAGGSYGVTGGGIATVTNTGLISQAETGNTYGAGIQLGGGLVTNNGGTIVGGSAGVYFVAGSGTVINTGTITGANFAVALKNGQENELAFSPQAVFSGAVRGGDVPGAVATSTMLLLPGTKTAGTYATGTLAGFGTQFTEFSNVTVAMNASWALAAGSTIGAGYKSTFYTLDDLGTLTNSGSIESPVTVTAPGVLTNAASAVISTAFTQAGTGAAVYGVGGPVGVTNAGTITTNGSVGITLSAGGSVINQAGGIIYGITGITASGAATITNAGTIVGHGGTAVALPAGFANNVSILPGGVFTGFVSGGNSSGSTIASTIALLAGTAAGQAGTFHGAQYFGFNKLSVASGATWTLAAGGAVGTPTFVSAGKVINDGGIFTNVSLASGPGVYLSNASSGTISTPLGVILYGAGTVLNAGYIDAQFGVAGDSGGYVYNQQTGTILAGSEAISFNHQGVSIRNAGTLISFGLVSAADMYAGGSLRNDAHGFISGQIGVYVHGAAGTVSNAGTIIGTNGTAVSFHSGYANTLAVSPSGVFQGVVNGGNTLGASVASELLLTAGSVGQVGTLSGFGTEFINFASLVVDTGANWSLLGAGGSFSVNGQMAVYGVASYQSGLLEVGQSAAGHLIVHNQGTLFTGQSAASGGLDIAPTASLSGSVTVSGSGALIDNTGRFVVGDAGTGSLQILAGGTVITNPGTTGGRAVIGRLGGASGSGVLVSGTGSDWEITGSLIVGNASSANLSIGSGGTVSADMLAAGFAAGSSGGIAVSGTASLLSLSGTASIGNVGSGSVSILDGATISVGSTLLAGQTQGGGSATIDIEGASTLLVGADLNLGVGAASTLTAGAGATVRVADGGINLGLHGVLNLSTAIDAFFISDGTVNIQTTQTQTLPDFEENTTFNLNAGIAYVLNTPTIFDGAVFNIGSAAALTLNSDSTNNSGGTAAVNFSANAGVLTLGIDNLGTIETQANNTSSFVAEANPNLGQALIGGFNGVIGEFVAGDTIVVDTTAAAHFAALGSSEVAVIANGSTLGVLDFASPAAASVALATSGALVDTVVPCFAAGTLIRTDRGDVPVEQLREGDTVWSVLHRAFRPVVWIGHRAVDCARHPAPHRVWPVRIAAGAFGPDQPLRDLYLSPDHALYIDGVLVPARYLVNGGTIRQIEVETVAYHHVELRRHDVLLAEGLPAESYLDTGDRANFANGGAVVALHPSWGDAWEMEGCAPLVVHGPDLQAIRQRLSA